MTGFNSCLFSLDSSGWLSRAFFCFQEGHVKCGEQKQNTLHCNSLEYYAPFMQFAWQPLPSLCCWNLCLSAIPLWISCFCSWNAKFICHCKHCIFLLTGTFFFFFPSSQPDQDASLLYNTPDSSDKSHAILNVLYKRALLQRLFNGIWKLDCDLNFVHLYKSCNLPESCFQEYWM